MCVCVCVCVFLGSVRFVSSIRWSVFVVRLIGVCCFVSSVRACVCVRVCGCLGVVACGRVGVWVCDLFQVVGACFFSWCVFFFFVCWALFYFVVFFIVLVCLFRSNNKTKHQMNETKAKQRSIANTQNQAPATKNVGG